jgi:hypothetical protein
MKHRSILLYGSVRSTLETRQVILQKLGHQVSIATDLAELHRFVANTDHLDLLVLTHSLSKYECGRALMLTHARWPRMRSCVLSALDADPPACVVDEVSAAFKGPARFGVTLEKLVMNESTTYSHLY